MKKRDYLKEGLTDTEFRGLVPRDGGGIQTVGGGRANALRSTHTKQNKENSICSKAVHYQNK